MEQIYMKVPVSIVLADDDADDRYFFKKALEELHIPTAFETFPDGERLISYLMHQSGSLPDVLFLDINMPRKNGLECLAEIKGIEKLKHVPVVMYSTSMGSRAADALYRSGAHYCMPKCNYSELPKSIEEVLNLLSESPLQPPREKFMLRFEAADI